MPALPQVQRVQQARQASARPVRWVARPVRRAPQGRCRPAVSPIARTRPAINSTEATIAKLRRTAFT